MRGGGRGCPMEYTVERFSAACAGVTISYTAEDVADAFERAAKAIGKGMNLPGYRLGKIPTKVIKSRFASRVAADATELLADAGLIGILQKEGIRRISPMQYKGEPAVDGKPFEVKTSFDVLPDIELPDLQQLSVVVGDPQPSEDALNAMLDQALGRLSRIVEVTDRKPEDNDLLTVDVRGSVDGMALAGMILVNNPGDWGNIYAPFEHAEFVGLTLADLVFPTFMFVMGFCIPLAFRRYDAKLTKETVWHILKRTVMIFAIGLFLQWMSSGWCAWHDLRIPGVLQRLALCYGICAMLTLYLKPKHLITL